MRAHGLWLLSVLTCSGQQPASGPVRPGIEVLLSDSAALLAGKRLALLTNQGGLDRQGRRDVDLLLAASRARPAALFAPPQLALAFSPEHGFRGTEDRTGLPDATDSATGIPIYSLYPGPRRPNYSALDSVDVVLIDLQDIGARYYSYPPTAVLLMREAAHRGKRVIVLDRPNPVGGMLVQGNVRATPPSLDSIESSLNILPLPMRHGMTLGEILRMMNDELGIHADLTVVPAIGWRRDLYYDETAIPWVKPSPNMPDLESAMHYPGICLFEATNLSVGRGTAFAFQTVGAPWIDADVLLRALRDAGGGTQEAMAGVSVTTIEFTPRAPTDGKYDGVRMHGVRFRVLDRARYDPTKLAVALLASLHSLYPDSLRISTARFDQLAAGPELREGILAGRAPAEIWSEWDAALHQFLHARAKYLLY